MSTQTETQVENSIDTFNSSLLGEAAFLQSEPSSEMRENPEKPVNGISSTVSKVLRVMLLFLPGSFLLYYSVLSAFYFYSDLGITFQMVFMIVAGAFMCFAGSGNLKDVRSLSAPLVVAMAATLVAMIAGLFSDETQSNMYFFYSIYVFPLAIVASEITRQIVRKPKMQD